MSDESTLNTGPVGRMPRRVRIWAVCVLIVVGLLLVQAFLPDHQFLPHLGGGMSYLAVLAVLLAAMVCEYVDSSLGMGYGTTLTPLLLLAGFEPLEIVPAVLLSEFCTGITAALAHQHDRNVDLLRDRLALRTTLLLSSLSVVGAILAATVALNVPKIWLTGIIAVIVLSVGFVILATIRRQLRYRSGHIVVLGAIAAFNKALSGGGYGPLVTGGQVVSGISARQAVAVTSLAEGVTCAVGLAVYAVWHGTIAWHLALPLTIGALLSVPMATLTVQRMPETAIRGAVGIATCILGVLMVAKLLW